ncbi:MAG: SLBB domain-containing protein [Candidatus Binataceae bacterium]
MKLRRGTLTFTLLVGIALVIVLGAYAYAQVGGLQSEDLSNATAAQSLQQQQLLQGLGISPDQLQELKDQGQQAGLAKPELDRLCAGVAAKHLSAEEVQSIGSVLGLSQTELQQLLRCGKAFKQPGMLGQGMSPAEREREKERHQPSPTEQKFREADTPYKLLEGPQLKHLSQFGYNLFSTPVSTFAPVENVPVGSDYVLGPGDELNVILWGRVNRTIHLKVQRDGTVLMPQIGPIAVAGLTFEQGKKLIEGRTSQIVGVQTDVTMARIRTIQVFVIGQAEQPGLYTVSALAHVSDALVAAGGVRKTGSLRRIVVRRHGQIIKRVDLYSMLLHGNTNDDVQLQERDVILVPVLGPVVDLAGNVRNPAIYELGGIDPLIGALRMAGGVSAFGYAERVEVERIFNHERRIVLDVNLNSPDARHFYVDDGDLVKVFTVLPKQQDIVRVDGNVNQPGVYQWNPGMRVADLVQDGQGIGDHTYLGYALVKRYEGPTRKPQFMPLNLEAALSDQDSTDNLIMRPGDVLTIYGQGQINDVPTVTVKGDVRRPGTYPLTQGMRVTDLIYLAGGFKESAYKRKAELARTTVVDGDTRHLTEDVNLAAVFDGLPNTNVVLKPADMLFIAQAANWHQPWTVTVKGEVMRPGPYAINDGESLSAILAEAGGLRTDAYLPALILTRQSVKIVQGKNLDQARARLQTEIARAALMPEENKAQSVNVEQKAAALSMITGMLSQSAHEQATGRIVLASMDSLPALAASPDNVKLDDKDEIIVPRRPNSVNVLGQVYGPTAIAYQPALTVRDYIDRAGGLTEGAAAKQIFVVKVNGAIVSLNGYKDMGRNRIFPLLPVVSGGLMSAHLDPGDSIYVPAKLLFVNPIQQTLDVTQLIANSAEGITYAALLGTLL